jgi:predicted aldo/keto reductase-like oxidoreductase
MLFDSRNRQSVPLAEFTMQYRKFGRTGLSVSRLCLGTMTFGLQTEESVSHNILDRAAEAGVNFIEAAERISRDAPKKSSAAG